MTAPLASFRLSACKSAHVDHELYRVGIADRVARFLLKLPHEKAWVVEVREWKPKRSLSQNALLWALYDDILERGGETMRGWERNDLHTFFLIEHYGSEVKEIYGRRRTAPLKTSSGLTKQDFSDHIDFIVRFMDDKGVVLNLPESAHG